MGSILSTQNSNGLPSYGCCILATSGSTEVGTILPARRAPAVKGPSKAAPNQLPNALESLTAAQTRAIGACNTICFSIRSVFISNPPGLATSRLRQDNASAAITQPKGCIYRWRWTQVPHSCRRDQEYPLTD